MLGLCDIYSRRRAEGRHARQMWTTRRRHQTKPSPPTKTLNRIYLGWSSIVVWGHGRPKAQVFVARQRRVEELREGEREERVDLVAGWVEVLGGLGCGYELWGVVVG